MNSLLRGERDVVIRWAPWMLLGGLLTVLAPHWELPGIISGVFAIQFGAMGGVFGRWRSEKGLWMLAGLFLAICIVIYGLFAFGQARDLMRGAPRPDVGLMIDFGLATMLLSAMIRFLWRVAKYNWAISHEAENT